MNGFGCPPVILMRSNIDLRSLLLLAALVALVEFVHAAGCVDKFHLSCIERMRGVGNLDLYERISDALYIDGLTGVDTGAGDEHVLVGHILESYKTVGFGMYTFFHCVLLLNKLFPFIRTAKVYTISFPCKFSVRNFYNPALTVNGK